MVQVATLNADSNDNGIMNLHRSNAGEFYYGNVSYAEWCQRGRLALLRFRHKQNQRRVSLGGTTLLTKGSNDTSKTIPKKRPSPSCSSTLPLKKRAVALPDDTDLHSLAPSSNMETAAMSIAASLVGSNGCSSHSPEPLVELEDDGNHIDTMVMDDEELSVQQESQPPADIAFTKCISNAESSPSLPVAPSPFFSFWNRWRPTKTKKPQECFGRRLKPDPKTGSISFTVKEAPPQCIALIEGICDAVRKNPTGDQNYFASPHYHYLSDVLDHGQHDLMPRRGFATELPSAAPAYPGPWIAQIFPLHATRFDPSLPTRQSDWNETRIRLVHQEYEGRISPLGKENGISMARIDPAMRRMPLQQQGDPIDNLFIGAMAVVLFDGFATTSESLALQDPLAECILQELRDSLVGKENNAAPMLRNTILGIDVFTTKRGLGLRPSESVSGCGGVALPVGISCGGGTAKRSHDDYYLQMYTCETLNSIVAIEIVFDEAPIFQDGKNHMKSSNSPSLFDEHQGLTQKQLDHHASTCSAMNVLHLWKQHQDTVVPTTLSLEELNRGPLMSGEITCCHPSTKSAGSDTMSVVFTECVEEEENPAVTEPSNQPPIPSTFAGVDITVLNTATEDSGAEMCLDTSPEDALSDVMDVESPVAVLKADPPNCHSLFASSDSPMSNPAQRSLPEASELHTQEGVVPTEMTCLNKVSVSSTVIPVHHNSSNITWESVISKPFHHSLNHVTPTPYRPIASALPLSQGSGVSAQQGTDEKVLTGKLLFPETEMKQRMPVPVVPTMAVEGGILSDELDGVCLNAIQECSADLVPKPTSPNVLVSSDSEESWPSWLSVFYGLHDELEFPEMSHDELTGWIRNLTIDDVAVEPVCLHDALFGWSLDDFNHDEEASVPWFFCNWFIPIVTWGMTWLLISLLHSSMEASTLMPSTAAVVTDPSQFLLEPLLFEVTGLGYVGMVRIE